MKTRISTCQKFIRIISGTIFNLTIICFFIPLQIFAEIYEQDDTVKAANVSAIPVIDGAGDDDCWQNTAWQPIDQVWIDYGESVDSEDFTGQYKICWSSETNLVYFLVEIVDDTFIDGYFYPDGGYPNYDIVEIFIDEDKSGGMHVFDDNNDLGPNAENAFSYHIVPAVAPEEGGEAVTDKWACDIDGTGWGDRTIPNYDNHFPEFALKKTDGKYYWEFSMQVHNDTYDHDNPENSLTDLSEGKIMGLTVAYCDNDQPDGERDNFFGSVSVTAAKYNDHWKDADDYGTIMLAGEAQQTGTSDILIDNHIRLYPNPNKGLMFYSLEGFFNGQADIFVFDLSGRIVQMITAEKNGYNLSLMLDLSHLQSGQYFVITEIGCARLTNRINIAK